MNIDDIMYNIIENKYNEIESLQNEKGKFFKIKYFEGNAIGQIGEEFVKEIFRKNKISFEDNGKIIHDEYDILSGNKKIEIKTARKGKNNNSFQFNGLNPSYNVDTLILIGLTVKQIYYLIINDNIIYNHKNRKYYMKVNNKEKQIVAMNPNNQVNYKLTLNLSDLKPIDTLEKELKEMF